MNHANESTGRVRRRSRRRIVVVAVGLGLALTACQGVLVLFGAGPTGPEFPHEKHIEELDCTACHDGAEDRADAGLPSSTKGCMLCHKDIDSDKPPERRISAFVVRGQPLWLDRVASYGREVKFSHTAHFEAELECEQCHPPQAGKPGVGLKVHGGKKRCLECHSKKPGKTECNICHVTMRRDVPPPSHGSQWHREHGMRSRERIAGTGETTCAQCHTQRTCDTCHQREAPRSHTHSWRGRGHGLAASMNRSSCAACHSPNYCDRCHQSSTPRSHRGTWGPPRSNHCVSCHADQEGQGCGACHKRFPAHTPGPSRPGNLAHMMASSPTDCLGCHVALKHANPGLDCRICHR